MLTPEGEERQKGTEEIFEKKKITEIFFKLMAISKELIQRVQRTPSIINTGEKKKTVCRHSFSNYIKNKEKILKETGVMEGTPYLQRNKNKNYI